MEPGEEYTVVFDVKIDENQDGSNIYKYRAFVDADRIIDEGDDEDNNEYSKSYKFYDSLKEVTFNLEDGNLYATWPASDDVKKYIVEYTVGDEKKQ